LFVITEGTLEIVDNATGRRSSIMIGRRHRRRHGILTSTRSADVRATGLGVPKFVRNELLRVSPRTPRSPPSSTVLSERMSDRHRELATAPSSEGRPVPTAQRRNGRG
jgi:hypothetical protein